jgi:hypothetical protein
MNKGGLVGRTGIPWILKISKRSQRIVKWESNWYQRWALTRNCGICGEDHPAMNKLVDEEGIISYSYNCPIAMNKIWPPPSQVQEERCVWHCLEASPSRICSYHGYSWEAIITALEKWEHYGSGILLTPEECESFKRETHLRCEVERQTWTFKKTLLGICGLEEESS